MLLSSALWEKNFENFGGPFFPRDKGLGDEGKRWFGDRLNLLI
jgi:hypothetical protein